MSPRNKRLEKLEEQIPVDDEPVFVDWLSHPWTEQEKAQVLSKHPGCTYFHKTLSLTVPHDPSERGNGGGGTLNGTRYIAGHRVPKHPGGRLSP